MAKKGAGRSRSARAAALLAEQRRRERRRRQMIIGGVVGVAVVALVAALFLSNRDGSSGGSATPSGVDGFGVTVGEASAPTTITVYEDPQCPVCREFESAVGDQVADAVEAGDVQVDYRIVSFLDSASDNEFSSRAANALYAVLDVAGPEAFAALHQQVYENQPAEGGPGPDDATLVEWAVEAGADEAEVRPLIEDKAFEGFVEDATDQMSDDGVSGTPTVFIDGERAGEDPQQAVDAVLEAIG